jgi:hypothetical protein
MVEEGGKMRFGPGRGGVGGKGDEPREAVAEGAAGPGAARGLDGGGSVVGAVWHPASLTRDAARGKGGEARASGQLAWGRRTSVVWTISIPEKSARIARTGVWIGTFWLCNGAASSPDKILG